MIITRCGREGEIRETSHPPPGKSAPLSVIETPVLNRRHMLLAQSKSPENLQLMIGELFRDQYFCEKMGDEGTVE